MHSKETSDCNALTAMTRVGRRAEPTTESAGRHGPAEGRALPDDLRFRLLRLLEQNPQMSQRALAQELGIALGSVNYVLGALIEKGLVKARNFRNAGNKLRYAYVLTPRGVAEKTALTAGFLRRKLAEYEALKAELEVLQAEMARSPSRPSSSPTPAGDEARP